MFFTPTPPHTKTFFLQYKNKNKNKNKNKKLIMSIIYDAVVSPDPNLGDYTLPSAAFANGALNVYMRRGVYLEPDNVVIPVGGSLQGENSGTTIIDFANTAYGLRVESGFLLVEQKGTMAVTSGSSIVVGTNTEFTHLAAGDCLNFNCADLLIASITSDTELVLETPYNGRDETNVLFRGVFMRSFDYLRNFTVRNSSVAGLLLSGCRRPKLENVSLKNCNPNLVVDTCCNVRIHGGNNENSQSVGVSIVDCVGFMQTFVNIKNNYSHGVSFGGFCSSVRLIHSNIAQNGGSGVFANGAFLLDGRIVGCIIKNNYANGVFANSSTIGVHVNTCTLDSNGDNGIVSSSNRMTITSSYFRGNIASGIDLSGNQCIISGCSGSENKDDIKLSGNACNICDNSFANAENICCHINSSAVDNIVTGNHFDNAGFANIYDEGISTLQDNNKP